MEPDVLVGLGMLGLAIISSLFIASKHFGLLKQKIKPRKTSKRNSYRKDR